MHLLCLTHKKQLVTLLCMFIAFKSSSQPPMYAACKSQKSKSERNISLVLTVKYLRDGQKKKVIYDF